MRYRPSAGRLIVELFYSHDPSITRDNGVIHLNMSMMARKLHVRPSRLLDTLEWMEKYGIITDLMVNRKNAKLSIREPEWKRSRMSLHESLNDIEFQDNTLNKSLVNKLTQYILKNKKAIKGWVDEMSSPDLSPQELTDEYAEETLERLIKKQALRDKAKAKKSEEEFFNKVKTESDREKGLSGRGKHKDYLIEVKPSQWDD